MIQWYMIYGIRYMWSMYESMILRWWCWYGVMTRSRGLPVFKPTLCCLRPMLDTLLIKTMIDDHGFPREFVQVWKQHSNLNWNINLRYHSSMVSRTRTTFNVYKDHESWSCWPKSNNQSKAGRKLKMSQGTAHTELVRLSRHQRLWQTEGVRRPHPCKRHSSAKIKASQEPKPPLLII